MAGHLLSQGELGEVAVVFFLHCKLKNLIHKLINSPTTSCLIWQEYVWFKGYDFKLVYNYAVYHTSLFNKNNDVILIII